jgi:spore maturation protein CgeB
VTVHIPRRPYVEALPGIPTIRPFEALACGIPLVCSRWDDVDGLFTAGNDYLVAATGDQMRAHLSAVLRDRELASHLAQHGRRTILERHTCGHRVDELLAIAAELGVETEQPADVATRTVS